MEWTVDLRVEARRVMVIGRLHFIVESRTTRNIWYAVDLEPDEEGNGLGCECEGFQIGGSCWHMMLIAKMMRGNEWIYQRIKK